MPANMEDEKMPIRASETVVDRISTLSRLTVEIARDVTPSVALTGEMLLYSRQDDSHGLHPHLCFLSRGCILDGTVLTLSASHPLGVAGLLCYSCEVVEGGQEVSPKPHSDNSVHW